MQKNTLGILGGGQLAKMLAIAAQKLNIDITCFESSSVENPCAAEVATVLPLALSALDRAIQTFTFETENISVSLAEQFSKIAAFYPNIETLKIAQDRLFEKSLFTELEIPTPQYFNIKNLDALSEALNQIQNHSVLKTRTMGYDGKGQQVIKWQGNLQDTLSLAQAAFSNLSSHVPLILESFVDFDYELSIIAVRNQQGEIRYYPLTKNTHQSGILVLSEAPFDVPNLIALTQQAQSHAQKILTRLNYVGILAIEFFVKNNQLIANEMAPRVHNSGHWTIEGAKTSQFENHVRAVCGLPLGSTEAVGFSCMSNMLSTLPSQDQLDKLAQIPGVYVHLYGKSPKPNRKLGHITFHAESHEALNNLMTRASIG